MNKMALSLASTAIFTSFSIHAAVPTTATAFQLEIPNLKSGLELFLEGLYLRATTADLDYAIITNPDFTSSVVSANPSYQFGFKAGIGYIFPNSGNDIQLAWTSYNQSFYDSYFTTPGQSLSNGSTFNASNNLGSTSYVGENSVFIDDQYLNVGSNIETKYNAIDLDAGQYVNVGTRLQMRLFAGLRGAKIEQNIEDHYQNMVNDMVNNTATNTFVSSWHLKNDFITTDDATMKGLGPRFGINSSYHVWNCVGITAGIAASLLVSEVEAQTSTWQRFTIYDNTSSTHAPISPAYPIINGTYLSNKTWRVVPTIDTKLGINYSYILRKRSTLTFEAGYQVSDYIDAIDQLDATGLRTTTSVGFDGPYVNLSFAV